MGDGKVRTSTTSRGILTLSSWNNPDYTYSVGQLSLGTNPNSRLEVVSLLNFFNLGRWMYHFNYPVCPTKYNSKVYLGAVQSVAFQWNHDNNLGLKNGLGDLLGGVEKSGSWPNVV